MSRTVYIDLCKYSYFVYIANYMHLTFDPLTFTLTFDPYIFVCIFNLSYYIIRIQIMKLGMLFGSISVIDQEKCVIFTK